ncbi:Ig-like domain-containing protein [Saccharibacillus brassicae]|nr:Ig-like domain-containing protein [Saccharibacillus brassicae]
MRTAWNKTIMSALVLMIILGSMGFGSASAAAVKVYGIQAAGPPMPFYVKNTFQLKPKVNSSSKTGSVKVRYKSGNVEVASVNSAGVITAVGAGRTNIEVTAGDKSVQLLVTVKSKVKEANLSAAKPKITVGEQTKLSTRIVMDSSILPVPPVSYQVSDPSVLFVDASGNVTALKEGKAEIKIRVEEKTAKVSIEVTDIEWATTTDQSRFERPAWSADSKYLALNGALLNAQDGRTIKKMNNDLAFAGNTLYSWNNEDQDHETMLIYDSAFRVQRKFEMPEESRKFYTESRYVLSPDGQHFYFQYGDRGIFDLDVQSGEVWGQVAPDVDTAWDMTIALSPNGQLLAVLGGYGYSDHSRIYDLRSGQMVSSTTQQGAAEFTPDSKYLVVNNGSGIAFLDTQSFATVRELPGEFEDFAVGVGGWLAVTNENGNVDVYDIETLEPVRSYATKATKQAQKMGNTVDQPISLTFSPDGRKLVAGYANYSYSDNSADTICWNLNELYLD